MPWMTIPDLIANASEELIIKNGAQHIGRSSTDWPFINANSPIANGYARPFLDDFKETEIVPQAILDEFCNYTLLSSWSHAFDSWRYLSQSALALLCSSPKKALHLAYYAELRAALSILAGSGIVIAKKHHFSISQNGKLCWTKLNGTHEVAWEVLKQWVAVPNNAFQLVEALGTNSILGIPWLEVCRATNSLDQVVSHWIQNWAVDLSRLKTDRDLRNTSSYEPDISEDWLHVTTENDIEVIKNIIAASSPDGTTTVSDALDLALIYDLCLDSASQLFTNANELSNLISFWKTIAKPWAVNNGYNPYDIWLNIKNVLSSPAYQILQTASISNESPAAVLCRAFLCSRLASAMLKRQQNKMKIIAPAGKLDWPSTLVKTFGLHSQLWSIDNPPTGYSTLHVDCLDADEALTTWMSNNVFHGYKIWSEHAKEIREICKFERNALWLLAS